MIVRTTYIPYMVLVIFLKTNMKLHLKINLIVIINVAVIITLSLFDYSYLVFILYSVLITMFACFYIFKMVQPLYQFNQKLEQTTLFKDTFEFKATNLKEVNHLTEKLVAFTIKTNEKFLKQKQYSENFSHELLTPLAIIRTKVELLLQSQNLTETDLHNIDSIIQTVNKLSKINKGLILLSKINNNQFIDKNNIDLTELINQTIENFQFLIHKKCLKVNFDSQTKFNIISNQNLIDILISNLIKNAVFHNINNGSIDIQLSKNNLIINNTGAINSVNNKVLFERFESNGQNDNSIGLGLSIVKNICDLFGFNISYTTQLNKHKIIVDFSH